MRNFDTYFMIIKTNVFILRHPKGLHIKATRLNTKLAYYNLSIYITLAKYGSLNLKGIIVINEQSQDKIF